MDWWWVFCAEGGTWERPAVLAAFLLIGSPTQQIFSRDPLLEDRCAPEPAEQNRAVRQPLF